MNPAAGRYINLSQKSTFMNYSDKLKDPRWQRKRLEILNRDDFTCKLCQDTKSTLHVHHKKYEAGKDPWEYENENFETLCYVCHSLMESLKNVNYTLHAAQKKESEASDTIKIYVIGTRSTHNGKILSVHHFNKRTEITEMICAFGEGDMETMNSMFYQSE